MTGIWPWPRTLRPPGWSARTAARPQQVDPSRLAPLGPAQRFSSQGGAPVETPDGSLWTAGAGGYVYSYAAGLARTRTHPAAGSYTLVEADNRPVAADTTTGEADPAGPPQRAASRSVAVQPARHCAHRDRLGGRPLPHLGRPDPRPTAGHRPEQPAARPALVVIGYPNARYGPAVISGNLVFVPSLSQARW